MNAMQEADLVLWYKRSDLELKPARGYQAVCYSRVEDPTGKMVPCGWKGEFRAEKEDALSDAQDHIRGTRQIWTGGSWAEHVVHAEGLVEP